MDRRFAPVFQHPVLSRRAVVQALGKTGSADDETALLAAATDADAGVRGEAALALFRMRFLKRVPEYSTAAATKLDQLSADPEAEARWRAAYAASRWPEPRLAQALAAAQRDVDARVRLFSGRKASSKTPELMVNEKPFSDYFPLAKLQKTVLAPFDELSLKEYHATVFVGGSGLNAQAEAIRLGLARALTALNPIWRSKLKSLGFLKRDPRKVERKKYGSRKARRPQQWRKR